VIDRLIDRLDEALDDHEASGHAKDNWYDERKRIVRRFMEEAYDLGKERGKEAEANYWNP
jgi:hypothetical protein